jgi:hypothetical protein
MKLEIVIKVRKARRIGTRPRTRRARPGYTASEPAAMLNRQSEVPPFDCGLRLRCPCAVDDPTLNTFPAASNRAAGGFAVYDRAGDWLSRTCDETDANIRLKLLPWRDSLLPSRFAIFLRFPTF